MYINHTATTSKQLSQTTTPDKLQGLKIEHRKSVKEYHSRAPPPNKNNSQHEPACPAAANENKTSTVSMRFLPWNLYQIILRSQWVLFFAIKNNRLGDQELYIRICALGMSKYKVYQKQTNMPPSHTCDGLLQPLPKSIHDPQKHTHLFQKTYHCFANCHTQFLFFLFFAMRGNETVVYKTCSTAPAGQLSNWAGPT